jgi:putative membrane protein
VPLGFGICTRSFHFTDASASRRIVKIKETHKRAAFVKKGRKMCIGHFWLEDLRPFFIAIPIAMIIMSVISCLVLGRLWCRGWSRSRWVEPPWREASDKHMTQSEAPETALEILKKRYAKGEITKREYDQMKEDLLD